MELNRRNFVRGAAAMGAVGAMGAAGVAWADAAPTAADDVAWDAEYDVVVLGLGGAGANAAVAAYEEGAKVLVCEKAPEGQEPCNTKASGQFVIATDDAEELYNYFAQLMGKFKNWDEESRSARPTTPTSSLRRTTPPGSSRTTPGAWAVPATCTPGTSSPRSPSRPTASASPLRAPALTPATTTCAWTP